MAELDFLLARIHGKFSRMLAPSDVQTLEKMDMDAIAQRLRATCYGASLGKETAKELSADLRRGLLADMNDLFRSLRGDDRRLLSDVLCHYRVENLKTLIRTQFHEYPPELATERILHLPWESADYDRWLLLPGLDELLREIPWPEFRSKLEAVHRQVGDTTNSFAYEGAVDNVYLGSLIGEFERRQASVKNLLRNRLLRSIVSWAFRLKEYDYSFPETINFLPDFRPLIRQHELRGIVEDEDGWRRVGRFFGSNLAAEWEKADAYDAELADSLFDRHLIQLVRRELIVSYPGIGIVLGYVYMKEIELGWLIEVTESARMVNG